MAEETVETPRTSRDPYFSQVPSGSGTDPEPIPKEQRERRVDKVDVPYMTLGDKAIDVKGQNLFSTAVVERGQNLSGNAVVEQHSGTFTELAVDMI